MSKTDQSGSLKLLLIIALIAVVVGFYMYILKPMLGNIAMAEQSLASKEASVAEKVAAIEGYEANKEKVTELRAAAQEEAKRFYVDTEQEDYLLIFMNLVKNARLNFESGSSTENTPYNPNYSEYECIDPKTVFGEGAAEAPEVVWMPIDISVNGTYVRMLNFLSQVKEYEKYIMCDSMSLNATSTNSKDPQMSGQYKLRFVRIMQIGGLLDTEPIPDIQETPLPAGFIEGFKSGSYKSTFSLSSIPEYLADLIA